MSIADSFLAEWDMEKGTTRRFLERLPAGRLDWKPHEKSLSAGQLALHIATAPGGIVQMAVEDAHPLPDFSEPFATPASTDEVLAAFDESDRVVRATLPTFGDERMAAIWTGTLESKPVFRMPRATMLRALMCNHIYHHRGQFGVYLRLMGARVPSSYGPSGDEQPDVDGA